MRKLYLLLIAFYAGHSSFAQQSIGIGTTTPEYKLHILTSTGESSLGINATGTATASLLNLSIDNRIDGNALLILKYRPGVAGNFAGIPRSNLSILAADAGAGALLIGTNQNSAMHFATNVTERMRLTGNGLLGINTVNPGSLLQIDSRADIPVSMSVNDNQPTGGLGQRTESTEHTDNNEFVDAVTDTDTGSNINTNDNDPFSPLK